jgi:hypothetical protein
MKKSDIIVPILRSLAELSIPPPTGSSAGDTARMGGGGGGEGLLGEGEGFEGFEETEEGGQRVMFFDDDLNEVLDQDLRKETQLDRVLFVSSSWAQRVPL